MAKQRQPRSAEGKVFLVGAGPGDAGLITWRGVECLRQADVVLFDYLVNPAILRHAKPQAELVCLGRHRRDAGSDSDPWRIHRIKIESGSKAKSTIAWCNWHKPAAKWCG